jgi:lysyl-tRNA synthetase class 1
MLLNLASAASAEDKETLWGFIRKYRSDADPETHRSLDLAAEHAIRYYERFVKPSKAYRMPTDQERAALTDLRNRLEAVKTELPDEGLQEIVYSVGMDHGFDPLRSWFSGIYEVLLGAKQGPRFGVFIAVFGVKETVALIDDALAGEFAQN